MVLDTESTRKYEKTNKLRIKIKLSYLFISFAKVLNLLIIVFPKIPGSKFNFIKETDKTNIHNIIPKSRKKKFIKLYSLITTILIKKVINIGNNQAASPKITNNRTQI